MSMCDYAVDDYGLVLNLNHLHCLASRVLEDFTEDEWDDDMMSCVEAVVEIIDLNIISNFSGETFPIRDDGGQVWLDTEPYSRNILCIKK